MNYIINNSNICKHAIRELKLAGYGDGKGGPNNWMYQQVIEAVAVKGVRLEDVTPELEEKALNEIKNNN